ncbi:MAG: hypothetical protein ACJ76F_00650 [Bacteroidia bacterium]
MRKSILIFCAGLVFNFASIPFSFSQESKFSAYDLSTPNYYYELPDTLREVSGICLIDSVTIACIQDENGILFIYDLHRNKIKQQFSFGPNGDYEDLGRVGKSVYILRSDGMLFEVPDYTNRSLKILTYSTGIPAKDNEGLWYDKEKHRLLIACKGELNKGSRNKRAVYSFNLQTKALDKAPVLEWDLADIYKFIAAHHIALPPKIKKGGKVGPPEVHFHCSAIAVHPLSKKVFLLSASDHLLFICNSAGTLEQVLPLDPFIFNQPEGIAFLENGDLLISNEAQGRMPSVLRFNYKGE